MAEDNPIGEIQKYLNEHPSDEIHVPDGVGDAEAVHAVQQLYDQAGFDCPEAQAQEIVREARNS
jgi:hypothetical protein